MKTYNAPTLVAKGGVVATTQGSYFATDDPDEQTSRMPTGGVGFGL